MRYNRLDLIERLKARVTVLDERSARNHEEAILKYEKAQAAHLAQRDLRPIINLLRRADDSGRVITSEDWKALGGPHVNTSGWSGVSLQNVTFRVDPPKAESFHLNTVEHKALIAFLEAVTDEFVSTSGLANEGFRKVSHLIR